MQEEDKVTLDKAQQKIVDCTDNRICVIAGAGSGKTRCLTERVKRLLNSGVNPRDIVCITLTNMAASEMRERLSDIPQSANMFIGTIHSYAYGLYVRHFHSRPKILTGNQERELGLEIIRTRAKHLTVEAYENWCKLSNMRENGHALKSEVKEALTEEQQDEVDAIFYRDNPAQQSLELPIEERLKFIQKYEQEHQSKKRNPLSLQALAESRGFISFNSLLNKVADINKSTRIQHMLVDEFQDIGIYEYAFIEKLNPANIFVVGDDYQSIYEFKGSDFAYFKSLINNPKFTVFKLTNNYRSCNKIVSFSNKIISQIDDVIPKRCVSKATYYNTSVSHKPGCMNDVFEFIKSIDKRDLGKWFVLARNNDETVRISRMCYACKIPAVTFKQSNMTPSELRELLDSNQLKILTIHTAKGLESDNVLLYGSFPKDADCNYWYNARGGTEACRIYYVGATRARKRLVVINDSAN